MPPRRPKGQDTPQAEQRRLLYGAGVQSRQPTVADWEPNTELLVALLLQVVADNCTFVVRPGSGSRSMGIAIWEGDVRHPPKWLYDEAEVEEYCRMLIRRDEGEEEATDGE